MSDPLHSYDPSLRGAIATGFRPFQNNVVIPNNATSATFPRVEIGFQLPADLIAFYAAIPETAVGGIIFYSSTTIYTYLILVVDPAQTAKICFGGRTSLGVSEAEAIVPSNAILAEIMAIGEHSPVSQIFFNTAQLVLQNNAQGSVHNTATFFMADNSILQVQDNAALLMTANAICQLTGSAKMQFFAGTLLEFANGNLQIDWGSDFLVDPDGFAGPESRGRGFLTAFTATGNFSSAAAFFPTCWQAPSKTYRKGRTYRVWIQAAWSASVANSQCLIELDTGTGVTIVGTYRSVPLPLVAGQMDLWHEFIFVNGSGADVTTGIQVKLTLNTVNVNGAGRGVIYMLIEDYSSTAQFGTGASFPSL